MKPIGMLMREHRLIEKMIDLLKEELEKLDEANEIDLDFIDVDADFFRIYADRTHHGKEEDILFKALAEKELSREHRQMMELLIEEHKHAREIVKSMVDEKDSYEQGNTQALTDIKACIGELIVFYPQHIEKEDKQFFYPSMEYFSNEEQDEMIRQFQEFDLKMIHEKYREEVEELGEELQKE